MYDRYQKLLDEKGLKNADVARATKISNMTLSDWKNGKSTPKADKLQKIADFLDVSIEYLTTGKETSVNYLYTDENSDFLIEVTNKAKDKEFVERMKKYMSLLSEDQKSINDMIDFMYNKEKKDED